MNNRFKRLFNIATVDLEIRWMKLQEKDNGNIPIQNQDQKDATVVKPKEDIIKEKNPPAM